MLQGVFGALGIKFGQGPSKAHNCKRFSNLVLPNTRNVIVRVFASICHGTIFKTKVLTKVLVIAIALESNSSSRKSISGSDSDSDRGMR